MVSYVKFQRCSQSYFDALAKKDQDTLYFVYDPSSSDNGLLYLGNRLIAGSIDKAGVDYDLININDIRDIIIKEGLADNDILLYNEGTKKWENHPLQDLLVYSTFIGATGVSDGVEGLVPRPTASDRFKFLMGDGTWQDVDVYDEDLHAVVETLVDKDEGMSVRDIVEDSLIDTNARINVLEKIVNQGDDYGIGLLQRVEGLEDTMGEFLTPLSGEYSNVGEALEYFDWSITSINDRMRWHNV